MKRYIRAALTPQEYNDKQTEVGSTLKTYKGSAIKRSTKYGVGKEIGGDIYFHKMYADEIIPADILDNAEATLAEEYPNFQYNCIRYSPKTGDVSFQESPDFDTAREPKVGDYVTVKSDGTVKTGHSEYIFHHKWLWTLNDYPGFDVVKSWGWSRQWLNTLQETSDGNGIGRWNAQLKRYGLPIAESRRISKRYIQSAKSRRNSIMKRYIKATTNPVEVFHTGSNIWFAEMDLGDGTYAVVSNEYENELAIYTYPESGDESDKYYAEDMIYDENVPNMDSPHKRIYQRLYKALQEYGVV